MPVFEAAAREGVADFAVVDFAADVFPCFAALPDFRAAAFFVAVDAVFADFAAADSDRTPDFLEAPSGGV